MNKTFTIYKITNIINGKVYIDRTAKTPEQRFREHLRHAIKLGSTYKFHAALRKHGHANFKLETVETNVPQDIINERESWWIEHENSFNRGYNMNAGGSGLTYYTESQRMALSEAQKASYATTNRARGGNYGPMPEETKEKLREKALERYADKTNHPKFGKIVSDETRKKISDANVGKVAWNTGLSMSDKTKAKLSASKTGVQCDARKKNYTFISPEGNIVNIFGIAKWCKENNMNAGNMVAVSKGRLKSYRGWKMKDFT